VHDFLIKDLGRAVPYGIYDLAANAGWVSVGMDNDTSAFAVNTIRRWWIEVGLARYPKAKRLLITADGGEGSQKLRRPKVDGGASVRALCQRGVSPRRTLSRRA